MPTPVPANARNPLRTYRFRLRMDTSAAGDYVAGVRSVSGLTVQVGAYEVWEGGNNLHRYAQPHKVSWDNIVLEQGLAVDDTLERWARAVLEFVRTGKAPGEAVKRDVFIDLWDEYAHPTEVPTPGPAEARIRSFHVHNAWVSKYHALPKLDAMAGEVALMSVELTHEGWEPVPRPPPSKAAPSASPA
ncbi:phage tail protein [Corallococcus praedator]|uniref:Phage tail protein n=1 Tax=Corallococcus praedator TaxID=2316724 RepID=A0ABX9QCZ5_9BACT|nr:MULTISPECIES: phage tail protein [Corallococcus]RKH07824.1 phage tail protein [Corallococcus sp. CA047B]RKH23282.1 phage tail protein [Corallococcus sp. CA031C]RKH97904.1 phage tail protein [Corallococcus praedator]